MENEARQMKIFVRGLMRGSPDLSVLTQRSIREQFLKHVGHTSLEKEKQQTLKKIVEKELLKMQVDEPTDGKSPILRTMGEKTKKRARSSSCSSSDDGPKKDSTSTKLKKPVPKKKHLDFSSGEHSDTENTRATFKETPVNLPAANKSDKKISAEGLVKSSSPRKEANIQNGTVSKERGAPNKGSLKGKAKEELKVKEIPRKGRPLKVRYSESSSEDEESEEPRKLKKPRKRPLKKRLTESSSEEEKEGVTVADSRTEKLPKPSPSQGDPEGGPNKSAKLKERSLNTTLAERSEEEQEPKKETSQKGNPPKASKANNSNDSSEEETEEESEGRKNKTSSKEVSKQRNKTSQRKTHPEARKGTKESEGSEEEVATKNKGMWIGRSPKNVSLSSSEEEDEEPKKHSGPRRKALQVKKTKNRDSGEQEMSQMHGSSKKRASKAQKPISGGESSEEEKSENNATSRGILHKPRRTRSSEEEEGNMEKYEMTSKKPSQAIARDSSEEMEEEPKANKVRKSSSDEEMPTVKQNILTENNMSTKSRDSDSGGNAHEASTEESASSGSADEEALTGRKMKGEAPARTHTKSSTDDSSEEETKGEETPVLSKGKSGTVQKTKGTSNSSNDSDSSNDNSKAKDSSQPKKDHHDGGSDTSSSSDDQVDVRKKQSSNTKEEKGKKQRKKTSEREQPTGDDHPSIKRLKRYINACGVRKNYKKLFEGHRSVKSKVAVLKQELEDLGIKGNPTLEKCKVVKLMREEREELASLDLSNIISNSGRPRRRSAWEPNQTPTKTPQQEHKRYVGSDSEDDEPPRKRRIMDWGNLQGIISDDSSG